MSDNRVRCVISQGVADVRLNRPDKMNALDPAMFEAIAEIGERLATDTSVKAVVLSGEGRGFCAGLDKERLEAISRGESLLPFADLTRASHGVANWAQHIVWQWHELPVPVIAAVHGVAFGGGLQLALGADIRYVTANTQMSILEIKWGLVPDMSGTLLMRHLASDDIVKELTFTGRIFSGHEAVAYGLATRVVDDPHSTAMKVAEEIAGRSPHAVRAAKRLLNRAATCDPATVMASERAEQHALIASPNQVEAVSANLANRLPQFVDPKLGTFEEV